jgi:hypothetical protein
MTCKADECAMKSSLLREQELYGGNCVLPCLTSSAEGEQSSAVGSVQGDESARI